MALIAAADRQYGYGIHLDEIAPIWKGGCIIRAAFLDEIEKTFRDLQRVDAPGTFHMEWTKGIEQRVDAQDPKKKASCVAPGDGAGVRGQPAACSTRLRAPAMLAASSGGSA